MKLNDTATLARLAGHLGFLILLAMSVVLASERVLFVDSAAQLFEMIQRENFVIYDHRYTMAVTQLLPLIGIKIGLPLPILVVLYSMSAPLLAYLAFLLLAYRIKDLPLALLLLLPMLCIRHTFFHAISESFSLAIYATLLLALLRHRSGTVLHAVGVVLCTAACVFMHPIGMFFVVFLLGYHLVSNRLSVPFIVSTATLLAAVIIKMNLGSGHDASYMPTVADTLSFYYKVSSEENYDKLIFKIDGQTKGEWSGNISWTRAAYPVNPGVHTYQWTYSKDYYGSSGHDCAYIDYISFPCGKVNHPIGINEYTQNESSLRVWPNPSTDYIHVTLDSESQDHTFRIYDLNGRLLQGGRLTGNDTQISVNHYASGTYILQVEDSQHHIQTKKIVKK